LTRTLGRLTPPDFEHVSRFSLEQPPDKPTPVVLGINWYTNFDHPQKDGSLWVIGRGDLGSIRGGHCVCLKDTEHDYIVWWKFYDQGREGACTGFGTARALSLMRRTKYDGFWLYHEGQKHGGYFGEDGAYVRDVLWVAANVGPLRYGEQTPRPEDGISEYRWATSVEDIHASLKMPRADQLGMVPILNSWDGDYPHVVWMPDETLDRLLKEDGEAAIVVRR
jgi:hypothetical protein